MKRALTLLAPALLALGLVACGDDDDDDSPDTTTATEETSADVTTGASTEATDADETESETEGESSGDAQTDAMREVFPRLSDEQIDCLVEAAGDATGALDPTEALALAEDCDIDPAELEVSIPSLPAELLEQAEEQFAQLFPNLTDDQISCLIGEFQSGTFDPSQASELAETCDIDPADLQSGG